MNEKISIILDEFHKIDGQILKAVRYVWTESCLDKIILEFEKDVLLIEAEPEDDTIRFHKMKDSEFDQFDGVISSHSEVWNDFIGLPFGWGWITINQQNYLDGVLLSCNSHDLI